MERSLKTLADTYRKVDLSKHGEPFAHYGVTFVTNVTKGGMLRFHFTNCPFHLLRQTDKSHQAMISKLFRNFRGLFPDEEVYAIDVSSTIVAMYACSTETFLEHSGLTFVDLPRYSMAKCEYLRRSYQPETARDDSGWSLVRFASCPLMLSILGQ